MGGELTCPQTLAVYQQDTRDLAGDTSRIKVPVAALVWVHQTAQMRSRFIAPPDKVQQSASSDPTQCRNPTGQTPLLLASRHLWSLVPTERAGVRVLLCVAMCCPA